MKYTKGTGNKMDPFWKIITFIMVLGGLSLICAIGFYGLSLVDAYITRNPVDQLKFRDTGGSLKLIHNVTGRYENEFGFLVPGERDIDPFEKATKLVLYGFTPISNIRKFENWNWVAWEQDESGKYVLTTRHLDYISTFYHQFPYGALVEEVEIIGDIRCNLKVQFTIQLASPRRAFGKNHHFLQLVIPHAVGVIGELCRDKTFAEVKELLVGGPGAKTLRDEIRKHNGINIGTDDEPEWYKLNDQGELVWNEDIDPTGYLIRAGIIVLDVALVEIESRAAASLERKAIAEMDAAAVVATAEGERLAAEKRADAEAYTIRKKAEAEKYSIEQKTEAQKARAVALIQALGPQAVSLLIAESLPNLQMLGTPSLATIGLGPKPQDS